MLPLFPLSAHRAHPGRVFLETKSKIALGASRLGSSGCVPRGGGSVRWAGPSRTGGGASVTSPGAPLLVPRGVCVCASQTQGQGGASPLASQATTIRFQFLFTTPPPTPGSSQTHPPRSPGGEGGAYAVPPRSHSSWAAVGALTRPRGVSTPLINLPAAATCAGRRTGS